MSLEPTWSLFLDFDGTLVDIAARPDAIVVDPLLPGLLGKLSARLGGAVAIVSGRTIADLERYLPDLPIDICGLHGLERRIAGSRVDPPGARDLGPEIARLAARLAAIDPRLIVEGKRVGVAVHWREAPEREPDALAALADLQAELGPGYRIQAGKCVREIVPLGAGKGGAVRALAAVEPYLGRRPIFAGDDLTDEAGFAAVRDLGGEAVMIGPERSSANRRVASGEVFRAWLTAFADGRASPDALPIATD